MSGGAGNVWKNRENACVQSVPGGRWCPVVSGNDPPGAAVARVEEAGVEMRPE